MEPTWTEPHERLLATACPEIDEPGEGDLARIWNLVEEGRQVRPGRRSRRFRIAVGAGVAAVLVGSGGIAAAALHSAHTGKGPVDAEDRRLGGPGERLDGSASDYGTVVAQVITDIPFPSDAARRFAVQDQVRDARGDDALTSTGALRAWVADAAICAWSNQWAAATRDGDDAARSEAIDQIRSAPSWSAVTAIDPHPSGHVERIRLRGRNGGHVTTRVVHDDSQFYYLVALGRAVGGSDSAAVAGILAHNNGYCSKSLVPDLPAADPGWAMGE